MKQFRGHIEQCVTRGATLATTKSLEILFLNSFLFKSGAVGDFFTVSGDQTGHGTLAKHKFC